MGDSINCKTFLPNGSSCDCHRTISGGHSLFMTITIMSDSDTELEFFVLSDGLICISHKIYKGHVHVFFLTQNEFVRIVNFINESIQSNNE